MSREQSVWPVQISVPKDYRPDDLRLQIDLRFEADHARAELHDTADVTPTAAELCRLASGIYRARRRRDKMLDGELFGEPAWDMMLALYCLPQRGERLGVTSLCYAANVAQTTGLRVQTALAERGLIERRQEPSDARRQLISLTEKGRMLLEGYLASLFRSRSTAHTFQRLASA